MLSTVSNANARVHFSPACEAAARRYRFANVEVDFHAAELRRSGVRVRIQDQPLHLLAVLLSRQGELVTREELRQLLWAEDTFVDFDHSLNSAVKRLRDVLHDNPDNPRLIETVPRHGYRFIAPVSEIRSEVQSGTAIVRSEAVPTPAASVHLQADAGESTRRLPSHVSIISLAMLLTGATLLGPYLAKVHTPNRAQLSKVSLAVLPFRDLSEHGVGSSIAAGMTQELTTQLGKDAGDVVLLAHPPATPGLNPGTMRVDDAGHSAIDYVLEGSVQVQPGQARIAVQLIRVKDRRILWTEAYDQAFGDLLQTQRRVAQSVVRALVGQQLKLRESAGN